MSTDSGAAQLHQVIGIDLGGTTIKLGRFDREGRCWQSLSVPTPQPAYPEAVLAAMVEAIAQLDPQGQSQAIGVGTPGPADAAGRIARVAINLAGWQNVPLADWLEEKIGKPTILANDANCAGLGEYWLGAGRPFRDLIMLTLGTGVGGAVILKGELFVGSQGTAGELGLITLNPNGPDCNSGNRGSLEQYVSVQSIRRRTGLEPEELGIRARSGDTAAIAFWESYGRDLGAGLASLVYVLTPAAVIIGGGVSASAEFFFPAAWAELERRVLPSSRAGLQLLKAELGNQAGMVGAAKLAWQKLDTLRRDEGDGAMGRWGDGTMGRWGDGEAREQLPANRQLLRANHQPLITELEQTGLAYQRAVEMAQFKSGFLARTSHELRSPINSVISLHQLILSDLCDNSAEERDFVAQAHTAAKAMLCLLDELINVSKAEYGSVQPQIQPVSLTEILEEVHRLTHLQALNRGLRLEIEHPQPDVYVLADPDWLRQVLVSLLDTPLALMQEGTIRITTHLTSEIEQAHIWIEDQRPVETWREPLDLLRSLGQCQPSEQSSFKAREGVEAIAHPLNYKRSPGLSLLTSQTLLEQMQGRLELLTIPEAVGWTLPPDASIALLSDITRIQCSVPLIVPEAD
jgi:glucokinase